MKNKDLRKRQGDELRRLIHALDVGSILLLVVVGYSLGGYLLIRFVGLPLVELAQQWVEEWPREEQKTPTYSPEEDYWDAVRESKMSRFER